MLLCGITVHCNPKEKQGVGDSEAVDLGLTKINLSQLFKTLHEHNIGEDSLESLGQQGDQTSQS